MSVITFKRRYAREVKPKNQCSKICSVNYFQLILVNQFIYNLFVDDNIDDVVDDIEFIFIITIALSRTF